MKITVYGARLSPFVEKTLRGIQHEGLDCEVVEPKSPGDGRLGGLRSAPLR